MFTIRREQGRLAEVAPVLRRFLDQNPQDVAWRPGLALIASDLGFQEAARKAFEDFAARDFAFPVDAKWSLTIRTLPRSAPDSVMSAAPSNFTIFCCPTATS